jgi:hypothetical protein
LLLLLDGLIVKLGRFIECGLDIPKLLIEIVNLLSEPVQQAVTFTRIRRP